MTIKLKNITIRSKHRGITQFLSPSLSSAHAHMKLLISIKFIRARANAIRGVNKPKSQNVAHI